jgi:ribosome maturation factor RimP
MGVQEEVYDLAEAVARRRSLILWDVEMGGHRGGATVRVVVDADGGIDLDTIAEVSEEISRGLDLRGPLEGRYTLEVSSPGLERKLRRSEHFSASRGKKIVLKTKEPLAGESHRIDGVIVDAGDGRVRVATGSQEVDVPFDAIKSARTAFE